MTPITDNIPTWLVLGSAPSAPLWVDAALERADHVITTNSGWHLLLTADTPRIPDLYFLNDPVAVRIHARAARYMQQRGARILTSTESRLEPDSGLDLATVERLPLRQRMTQARDARFAEWRPGHYINGRTSGAICVQHVATMIAAAGRRGRIILVGFDGYRSMPHNVMRDTFDGRYGKAGGQKVTERWQGPLLQAIVNACPSIDFYWFGTPDYIVTGPNVCVVDHDAEIPLDSLEPCA